jgi:phage/plasmid-associated DNA primase
MSIDLRQVAAISGFGGLFKVVKPTRTGVIVESIEENPKTMVAQARHRMSLLDEISIYTTDEESTVPLADVFQRVHEKFGDTLPLGEKPSNEEYKEFMRAVLPDYDDERVYVSDMKKLAAWYLILNKHVGFANSEEEEKTSAEEAETETATKKKAAKKSK